MNNDCKMLHETYVKDLIDIISNAKKFDEVDWIQRKHSVGSLARRYSES